MAILQSCCCWQSVRQGSYASAAYTTIYFSVTAITMALFLHEENIETSSNGDTIITTTTTISPIKATTMKTKSATGGVAGSVRSFLEPEGTSEVTIYFGIAVLACATAGILASLLLIYGLYTDRRALLVPWVFTVLLTSLVDLAHTLYLLLLETMQFNPMTGILFTLDFFLLSLNVYSLLCVVSQYQEYKAGRGRAYRSQDMVPSVRYEKQPTATSYLHSRPPVSFLSPSAGPLIEIKPSPNASPTAPLALSIQENSGHNNVLYPSVRGNQSYRSVKHVQFPTEP